MCTGQYVRPTGSFGQDLARLVVSEFLAPPANDEAQQLWGAKAALQLTKGRPAANQVRLHTWAPCGGSGAGGETPLRQALASQAANSCAGSWRPVRGCDLPGRSPKVGKTGSRLSGTACWPGNLVPVTGALLSCFLFCDMSVVILHFQGWRMFEHCNVFPNTADARNCERPVMTHMPCSFYSWLS